MKKYLFGIFAVVLAITAMSFSQKKHLKTTTSYYEYLGTTTDLQDYKNANNWTGPISPGSAGCSGSDVPCEVMSSQSSKSAFVSSITDASVVDNNVSTRQP